MTKPRSRSSAVWSTPLLVGVVGAAIAAVVLTTVDPAVAGGRRTTTTTTTATTGSITTTGGTRTYRLYVPRSLPKHEPVPLLVALHGGFGSGEQFEATSGFDRLADAHHFIVAYPDGTPIRSRGTLANARVWNGGHCCGSAARDQVDDVGFISRLIDRISQQHDIDASRVYAAGHSNGAIMSYRLACELSDKIVAIGVQAGALEVDTCQPAQPVSVFHIHGTADRNIPIDGGHGDGIADVAFAPPRDAVAAFLRSDRCPATSATSTSPDNPDVTIETWQPCTDGTAVTFVTVAGASHAWMGPTRGRARQAQTGPPYTKYDASAAIWSFLAAHPRS